MHSPLSGYRRSSAGCRPSRCLAFWGETVYYHQCLRPSFRVTLDETCHWRPTTFGLCSVFVLGESDHRSPILIVNRLRDLGDGHRAFCASVQEWGIVVGKVEDRALSTKCQPVLILEMIRGSHLWAEAITLLRCWLRHLGIARLMQSDLLCHLEW